MGILWYIKPNLRGLTEEDRKTNNCHRSVFVLLIRLQIKLWDVRATKPVQEYKGHYNEHAYLPIHVCEPEGLLVAGLRGKHAQCLLNKYSSSD